MLIQRGTVKKVKLISEKRRSGIWGKFLTQQGDNRFGEHTEWYCVVRKNCILVRQIYYKSPVLYSCGFRSSCTIIDACSLPFRDGSSGVAVAVNDAQNEEYFLAYYSIKMGRIVKKILMHRKITKIVTVLDATKKNEIECLHENLKSFSHLIAVGTCGGDCFLVHFGIDLPNVFDPELRKPPFCSSLCKEVYVSAITYLERCRTIIIGFSCGAFITVNLLNGNDASYYYSSSPVYGFSCQEPMDDPRPVLYLWVAYSKGLQKNPHVILFVINFPNDEGHPHNEWTFSDLMITNYLTWFPEECTEWLSFRTIVSSSSKEHAARNIISERLLSTEESFLRVNVTDTSRMLMTWKTPKNTVKGALFDLNAFYYKRLPRQVTFTESFLKLNPFLSVYTLPITNDQLTCLDYLVNYSGVWQHQSPYSETNDFFIFAPSYSFEIITFNGNREFTIFVPSMQKVVLKWLDENFDDAMGQGSDLACAYLNAVGLAKTPVEISEASQTSPAPLENESVIISSLLFNGEINDTLKKHIIACPNYDMIHRIALLIWKEVVNAKQKFDELSEPWFDRIPRALSAADMYWLRNSAAVFHYAAELFVEISKRVPSEKIAEATTTNYSMLASRNLVFYANVVFLFHHGGLLPVKNYTAFNARMKAKVNERKERLATGSKLYIINLLEEMQSACPNEIFWCGLSADEWYPPNSIGTLLSAILAMKITETSKHKLIGYFLLDCDDIMGQEPKVFDRFKWRFPYKNQSICNQIESSWRNDCGLEPLYQAAEFLNCSETWNSFIHLTVPLTICGKITIAKASEPVCEVQQLMKRLLLNRKEIEFIKENLLKRPNGIREWNRFCLRRKMFSHLLPAMDSGICFLNCEFWPERPKSGVLLDRCDRWTAKILEDFPIIQTDDPFPRVLPTIQNLDGGGKMIKDTPSRQRVDSHPYLSPAMRSCKFEVLETPRQLHAVVHKSVGLETQKASNCSTSPVCDRRISNYERILPKEDLENVHRLLQTPTPRRRCTPGTQTEDSFASLTGDQFSPIPLPASILKTRKGRHENASADVTESQFKSLRFDLSNSFISNGESISSNTSQVEEQKCEDDTCETKCVDALDVSDAVSLDMKTKAFMEEHLGQQDELKIVIGKGEGDESTDAANQENPHKVSVEEQSDSDIVEDQERQDEVHERVLGHYFEAREEIKNHDKTEQSIMRNENSLIQESYGDPVTVSYEEQDDPDIILLDATAQDIVSNVHMEGEQTVQDVGSLLESTSTLTTSKFSRSATTFEVKMSPTPPKKRSRSLADEVEVEMEDNVASIVSESSQKKVSYEQEDETDPTSTEVEKAIVCHFEMKLTNICKGLNEEKDRKTYSVPTTQEIMSEQALSVAKEAEIEFSESVSRARRRGRLKEEDAANNRQAIRTFSSDSFQSSSSDSEISNSSHRMLTRSAARATKLASLSPEFRMTSRKCLESETNPPHSRETTPKRSTRATPSAKSSSKTEKTRRKRPESRTGSPCSRETTPRRSTRATPSAKSSPKTEKRGRKRRERTNPSHSRETTPKRSIHTTPAKTSPRSEGIQRQRLESETSLTYSREATPDRPNRSASAKSSPTRKSLQRSRTQSEQTEAEENIPATTPKASPYRRRRAASEVSQSNETSAASHPMLTRSARKAKSESGSPPKQRTFSGFEPTLAKIDEMPKKSFLRVGRKLILLHILWALYFPELDSFTTRTGRHIILSIRLYGCENSVNTDEVLSSPREI
uniref:ELYS-bb domain-containing protein n=1 Tax=Elaeophora elaphi TaxID=1147741 RepID=A0A158Q7Q8_9BILA